MAAALTLFSLSFQIGPVLRAHGTRAPACSMEEVEYRLNNYILSGPLKPLGNQCLIKVRKVNERTGGGLFVPTAETEKPKEGYVIAAGPGLVSAETGELIECPVAEGDLVLLSDFSGENIDYCGEKHIFIDANNLLGKFEDKAITLEKFSPIGDRVVVECAEAATETTTGIALALDDDDESFQGKVMAVGPGKYYAGKLSPVGIKAGEHVMYQRYAGADAKFDEKRFKIVFEKECIAKW